ncbi:chlorophyll A-B binding protein [Aureococcus anophagefferens]|nr:chlorophyll A-B binding protein [Aureococcus anophagefferens]
MFKLIVALCASSAVAFQSAMPMARATSSLKAVEEFEIGVQPPAGFFDPLNYCEDQPESFVRRRAVERKHGRVTMVAFVGILVHNANIEFPGYLSKSQGLKFSDISNGIYGLSKVPSAGLLQILLFFGLVELAWWPASNYSGDYGVGFFGAKYEGEEKLQKLNAEMANGRLAMLGVAGAMLAEGQTGETLSEQLLALNFNPFA